jgi:hypothetical protein
VYQEYAQFLRERYPALNIEGGNYPPPPVRAALAQVRILCYLLQFIDFFCVFAVSQRC